MHTYKEFETFVTMKGLAEGNLTPLRQNSSINVHFHSVSVDFCKIIACQHITTAIEMEEILPIMMAIMTATWPDYPLKDVLLTHNGTLLQNPFTTKPKSSKPVKFVTGTDIHVQKPELLIQLKGHPEVSKKFVQIDL